MPKTQCRNGHPRTPENITISPRGWVRCLRCQQRAKQQWRARQVAGAPRGRVRRSAPRVSKCARQRTQEQRSTRALVRSVGTAVWGWPLPGEGEES